MVSYMGIVMAVIFSAAAAYLGLKVGQVFEAAIPIAIIAVGVVPLPSVARRWARMSSSRASEPVRVLWWQECWESFSLFLSASTS